MGTDVHNSKRTLNAFKHKYMGRYNYLKHGLWNDLTHSSTFWYPFKVCLVHKNQQQTINKSL